MMTGRPEPAARSAGFGPPIAATLASLVSIQTGASFAKSLFPLAGPAGISALRLGFGCIVMALLWRPWRKPLAPGALRWILAYGLSLGAMNLCFYEAVSRIPVGICVALEFIGPLGLAMLHSSRRLDLAWAALAAAGVYLLLPAGAGSVPLDPMGIALSLVAALFWALYIVFAQKAGAFDRGHAVGYGFFVATAVVVPVGVWSAGSALLQPATLAQGLGVALLSSVIPYSLEMIALTRLPARVFGILMSIEPAAAALTGLLILGERLDGRQVLAIGCVILASVGTVATHQPAKAPPLDA